MKWVIATLSNAIENIQSKVDVKEYDFSNVQNRIILSSTKESIEQEILSKCKEKFGEKYSINKVKITLDNDFRIDDIDIYVKKLEQVASAGEIIDYIAGSYNIQADIINVIKENN